MARMAETPIPAVEARRSRLDRMGGPEPRRSAVSEASQARGERVAGAGRLQPDRTVRLWRERDEGASRTSRARTRRRRPSTRGRASRAGGVSGNPVVAESADTPPGDRAAAGRRRHSGATRGEPRALWPMVRRVTLTLGYKASNEQFGPTELLELVKHAESRGFEVSGVSDHLQPWRHNGGHAPAVLPWLGAAAASTTKIVARDERAHADDALPPGDRRAGVRDARVPGAGPDLPRRRHRRGDERDADHGRRVPRPQGAADEDGRGDHGHRACCGPRSGWTSRASTTSCGAPRSTTARTTPVPIYVAASGPLAAKLAGRVGDGFICTSGKDPQLYVTCWPTSRRARRRPAATTSRSSA